MKVGIYCRVSKDKHGKDRSLSNQEKDGIDFAISNDFSYELFVEKEGTSGTIESEERPLFFDLITRIKNNEIDILFAYDLSRLERNEKDRYLVIKTLQDSNARLFTVRDGYVDFKIPEVVLHTSILSATNSYMVSLTKANVIRTLKNNVSAGRVHSAPPYGYSSGQDKMLIVNPETSLIVKKIFDLCISGNGGNTIAKILSNEGVATPTAHVGGPKLVYRTKNIPVRVTVNKEGLKWAPATINRIIKSTIYMGERRWKGEIYPSPSIVTKEVFEKAQLQLSKNKNQSVNNTSHEYLLQGKIICGKCGNNYHGYTNIKRNVRVYQCYCRRIVNSNVKCDNRRIKLDLIEELIWQRVVGNPMFLHVLKEDFNFNSTSTEKREIDQSIEKLEKDISTSETAKKNLLELVATNSVDFAEIQPHIKKLSEELNELKNSLEFEKLRKEGALNQNQIISEVKTFQLRLAEFEHPDFDTKKALTNLFIDKIIVSYDKVNKLTDLEITLKLNLAHNFMSEKFSIDLRKLHIGETSTTVPVMPPLLNCDL